MLPYLNSDQEKEEVYVRTMNRIAVQRKHWNKEYEGIHMCIIRRVHPCSYCNTFLFWVLGSNLCILMEVGCVLCSSYTMPTRDVSRIHEAIINIPKGGARGKIDYCWVYSCDTSQVGIVWPACTMATVHDVIDSSRWEHLCLQYNGVKAEVKASIKARASVEGEWCWSGSHMIFREISWILHWRCLWR